MERENDQKLQEEMKQLLIDEGMEINEVDKDSFIQATAGVYGSMKNSISPEMQELVKENLGKTF